MSAKNSISRSLLVAFLLCLVCSVIVAGAAVILQPLKTTNKLLDRNKNILSTVGLFEAEKTTDAEVAEFFKQFSARFLDVRSGELLSDEQAKEKGLDTNSYNQRLAAKNPALSIPLTGEQDTASLGGSQAKYALVYLLLENNQLKRIVLPIHGYGLWGTLYGFIAIENDGDTIAGLSFYEHKETPGLGAKVDLPSWKAMWPGKKIYSAEDKVKIEVVKAKAQANSDYQIDGLSGATLTTRGVNNLVQFWMGELGYKKFLDNVKSQQLNLPISTLSSSKQLSVIQQGVN